MALSLGVLGAPASAPPAAAATTGPLHTTGTDSLIYDSTNTPVRLVGFNWSGTEGGGRNDYQKAADVCGVTWRTPSDRIGNLGFNYDDLYPRLRDWGYNVIRLPVSWHNLEPVAPVWNAGANAYVHTWSQRYLDDLKSIVSKARANGLMVILDMHQDYWSPALHDITNWDGSNGYCEGVGMPRWMYPTMDAKSSTSQTVDFYNGMNWFYRNVHDPLSTVTRATPWQLLSAAWDHLGYQFSASSGFADHAAVVGADILNEPYFSYVGGSPPAGQTVLQAAGARLRAFYDAMAPAITSRHPQWLLFFQDGTGGYNAATPSARETPTMTAKPSAPGNWVYSNHIYNFRYGTFQDGVTRHDDFGITVAREMLENATDWRVPLYVGEFTNFTLGVDARQLTAADMEQTRRFLTWAKANRVHWSFWAYVNPYRPMTVVDYTTNQSIEVVRTALATGLDVISGNLPPTAAFTASVSGSSTTVDGSGSSDPDGSIASYAWDFGDGSTATGAKPPPHAYAAPGTYTVRLTVTDDDGASGSTTKSVTIASPDPGGLLASDAFTRTVSSGWGAADTGGSWSACGSACSVGGGVGRFVVPAGQGVMSFLNSINSLDTDVAVDFSVDRLASSSGSFVSLVARGATGQGYWGKVRVASTGALTLSLTRRSNWAETTLSTLAVPGLTAAAGDRFRIRLQAGGSSPTALRAKVWRVGATEPAAWQLTSSDSTSALQAPDGIGVYGYVSGGATNGPVTMSLDNLSAATTSAPAGNQSPVAAFTSSAAGLTLSVDASGSSDPDGSIVSYAWDFGDATNGTGRTTSHTFAAAGEYGVRLTVTDDKGATASVSRQVTVTASAPASLVHDAFDRVVTGGWGTAPVGGSWTTASGGTRLSVTGGEALSRHTAPGNKNDANLVGVSSVRTDLRVTVTADAAGSGSGTYVYVAGRRVNATNRYDGRLRWLSGNRWVAALTANLGASTVTVLAGEVTVPGTFAPGTRLNLRLQVFGTVPTTVRLKAWVASGTEPSSWLLERTNSHAALQAAGAVGMQTYLSTSSTTLPLTVKFDDLTVQPVP